MNFKEELLKRNHWSQPNIPLEKMFQSKPNSPKTKFDNLFKKTSTVEKKTSISPDRSPNSSKNQIDLSLKEILATYDNTGHKIKSKSAANTLKKEKSTKTTKSKIKKQLDLNEGISNYDNLSQKFYNFQNSGIATTKNNNHIKKAAPKSKDHLNLNLGSILGQNLMSSIKIPSSVKTLHSPMLFSDSVPQSPQDKGTLSSNEYKMHEFISKKLPESKMNRKDEMIYYQDFDFDEKGLEINKELSSKLSTPKSSTNFESRKMNGVQKKRSIAKQDTAETFDGDSKSKNSAKNPSMSTTDQDKQTNGSKKHSPSRNRSEINSFLSNGKILNNKDLTKESYVEYMKTLYHKKRQESQEALKMFYSKPSSEILCNTSDEYKNQQKIQEYEYKNFKLEKGSKNFHSANFHKDSYPNLFEGSSSTREFLSATKSQLEKMNRKLSLEEFGSGMTAIGPMTSKAKLENLSVKRDSNEIAFKVQGGHEIKINMQAKFLNLRNQIKRKRSNKEFMSAEYNDASKNNTERKPKFDENRSDDYQIPKEQTHSKNSQNQYHELLKILKRTTRVLNDYKRKENIWENEKKLLLAEVNLLKEKYE